MTRLRVGQTGVQFPAGLKIFLFYKTSRPSTRPTQPTSQWVPAFFPRGKAQGQIIIISTTTTTIKRSCFKLSAPKSPRSLNANSSKHRTRRQTKHSDRLKQQRPHLRMRCYTEWSDTQQMTYTRTHFTLWVAKGKFLAFFFVSSKRLAQN